MADEQRSPASIRDWQEDYIAASVYERVVASGILDLIRFGQLNITVTNGVIQELSITSTFRPSRQKPVGAKVTAQV